jgi:hypothetical protein
MALAEIEFELPARQFELMGYPALRQGESLSVILDAGVLLPDPSAESWFTVQKEPLPACLKLIGPATYAFAGQIVEADLFRVEEGIAGAESGVVLVQCGDVAVRVTCAPQEDGVLPWGTWETRYLTGIGRLQGIVEEDFHSAIGRQQGITIWQFRRLILSPGDPLFGQWHETVDLLPSPYRYDRIIVTARVHRNRF